ncbi:hypothetical protein ACWF94_12000 [Streptomyces sp. NPDC055078]
MEQRFTFRIHRLCLWMGPLLVVIYFIGFLFLAKFWPPPSPDWSADRLSQWLTQNQVSFQIACIFMITGAPLIAPWGAAISVLTLKNEARHPVLSSVQLALVGCVTFMFVAFGIFWALASYRVGEISPEITQAFWDIGWFILVFPMPPVIVWLGSIGLGILWSPPEHPVFPRWSAYLAFVVCIDLSAVPAVVFFTSGQWSYTGGLSLWLPFFSFFLWLLPMTVFGFRAIARQEQLSRDVHPGEPGRCATATDGGSPSVPSAPSQR